MGHDCAVVATFEHDMIDMIAYWNYRYACNVMYKVVFVKLEHRALD